MDEVSTTEPSHRLDRPIQQPDRVRQQDHDLAPPAHLQVRGLCVDSDRGLSGKHPELSNRGQQPDARIVFQRDQQAGPGDGAAPLTTQLQLVAGERGGAARAVGLEAKGAVDVALVEETAHRPPDRLHVPGRAGQKTVTVVEPVTHAVGERLPGGDGLVHQLATAPVERFDAEVLDLRPGGDAHFPLDRQLDGKPVCVPAGPPRRVPSGHRLVAPEEVLDGPGGDVVRGGRPVGRRWRFVEIESWTSSPSRQAGIEGTLFGPELLQALLQLGQAHRTRCLEDHVPWQSARPRAPHGHTVLQILPGRKRCRIIADGCLLASRS